MELTVQQFIDIMLAVQDLSQAHASDNHWMELGAYKKLARKIEETRGIKRGAMDDDPIEDIGWWAHQLIASIPTDEEQEDEDTAVEELPVKPALMTREELLRPVYRTALLLRIEPQVLLATSMIEYRRLEKLAESLWASFQLELAEIVAVPHLTAPGRQRIMENLRDKARRIKHKDGSPWREHFTKAERLL